MLEFGLHFSTNSVFRVLDSVSFLDCLLILYCLLGNANFEIGYKN